MILKNDVKFEEKPICCFKNDKNFVSLQNLHFDPSRAKYITLDELSFMTLKSYAKFEEKLIRGLENDMSNLVNFHQHT